MGYDSASREKYRTPFKPRMSYQPTGDYLLLTPIHEVVETTIKDFVTPDCAKPALVRGKVRLSGPDTPEHLSPAGTEVVFSQASEYKFDLDGELIVVVAANNVILYKLAKAEDKKQRQLFKDATRCDVHAEVQPCPVCAKEYARKSSMPLA